MGCQVLDGEHFASVLLHRLLSVGFFFLHIYTFTLIHLDFFWLPFDLRRQDLTNAMSACFLFLLFLYLLAYWDSALDAFISCLEFGVEGLGCSLGYIDMYDLKRGRK